MNRAEIKSAAKQHIKGNIGILFVIALIIWAISSIASLVLAVIPVAGPIIGAIIITPAFALSSVMIYLNQANGQKPQAGDAFKGFSNFWGAFKVRFLVGLFTALWSILFIIPGMIKSLSYSMSMYILAENKEIGALEAIRRSKEMMHGHKMDLFVLCLSFLGWYLLGIVTLGIGFIWIMPYWKATAVNFYNKIKPVEEPEIVTE